MKKCSLCGGTLDLNKRCTLCGLDNTKDDSQYKNMINQSDCEGEPLTHVHTKPARPQWTAPEKQSKNSDQTSAFIKILVIIIILFAIGSAVFNMVENLATDQFEYSYEEESIFHIP